MLPKHDLSATGSGQQHASTICGRVGIGWLLGAVCPQITYLLPGGHVQGTTVGELDLEQLTARLRELAAAARPSQATTGGA